MQVRNTSEWSGIKYRMGPELAAAISVRTGRRSRRPNIPSSRNAGDLKFDIDGFKANELHTIGNPSAASAQTQPSTQLGEYTDGGLMTPSKQSFLNNQLTL